VLINVVSHDINVFNRLRIFSVMKREGGDMSRRSLLKKVVAGIGLATIGPSCREIDGDIVTDRTWGEYDGAGRLVAPPINFHYHRDCFDSPTVLHSHGFLASSELYEEHLKDLARQGYFVAAPNHDDSINIGGSFTPLSVNLIELIGRFTHLGEQLSEAGLNINDPIQCALWMFTKGLEGNRFHEDDEVNSQIIEAVSNSFDYRERDIALTLEKVSREYGDRADLNNVELGGHSLGGWAVARCLDEDSSGYQKHIERKWDGSIKSGICQAPPSGWLTQTQIGKMKPTMWMVGEEDQYALSGLVCEQVLASQNVSTHYVLTFPDAGHFSFCEDLLTWLGQFIKAEAKSPEKGGGIWGLFNGGIVEEIRANYRTGPLIQEYFHKFSEATLRQNPEALASLEGIWTDERLVHNDERSFIKPPEVII